MGKLKKSYSERVSQYEVTVVYFWNYITVRVGREIHSPLRWEFLSPACASCLTAAGSTTMRLPRPWRWNRSEDGDPNYLDSKSRHRTMSSKSTRSRLEVKWPRIATSWRLRDQCFVRLTFFCDHILLYSCYVLFSRWGKSCVKEIQFCNWKIRLVVWYLVVSVDPGDMSWTLDRSDFLHEGGIKHLH